MGAILVIIGVIGFIALFTALRGFVLYKLWGWFVVPFGIMPIGIWHALGISIMIGMVTNSTSTKQEEDATKQISMAIALPLVALVFGYIYHIMM